MRLSNWKKSYFLRNLKSLALLGLDFLAPGGAAILMYHSVGSRKIFFNVKPENFRWQMDWLNKKGYKVISLSELADKIGRKGGLSAKTISITFDDSFEDIYFNAFPILKKYGFPATVFTVADFIGKEQRNESTGIMFKTLNWKQIKEMRASGLIDFEPHGCSHKELNSITLDDARKEITESKKVLENVTGKSCNFFAYPRGKYNKAIVDLLKEIGFKVAVTVNSGRARENSDLLELPRQSIDSATGKLQFICKVR